MWYNILQKKKNKCSDKCFKIIFRERKGCQVRYDSGLPVIKADKVYQVQKGKLENKEFEVHERSTLLFIQKTIEYLYS